MNHQDVLPTVSKASLLALLLFLTSSFTINAQPDRVNWKRVKVLVYTRNGKGYVHDNIPFAVACIQKLGQEHGFKVDTTSKPEAFSESNLGRYTALLFASTNNDVFDTDAQRLALRRYIEAGGGFVGVHSVLGTERNWPWFKRMMGGTFLWHPKYQPYKLRVLAATHPSMKDVPQVWSKSDECYFMKELAPGPTVVLAHDLTSLSTEEAERIKASAGAFAELYPAAWYYNFDGGHTWCTALGHDKKDYADPTFINHLFQGLRYVVGEVKTIDFKKAYAQSATEAIR